MLTDALGVVTEELDDVAPDPTPMGTGVVDGSVVIDDEDGVITVVVAAKSVAVDVITVVDVVVVVVFRTPLRQMQRSPVTLGCASRHCEKCG